KALPPGPTKVEPEVPRARPEPTPAAKKPPPAEEPKKEAEKAAKPPSVKEPAVEQLPSDEAIPAEESMPGMVAPKTEQPPVVSKKDVAGLRKGLAATRGGFMA